MIEKEELLTIIPHKGKMMMLDRINKYNILEKSIEAEYLITEECIFYNSTEEGVPSWVGFEFMAQAVSAFIGLRDRGKGTLPNNGYILGISQMNISLPFLNKNSIITIKSNELEEMYPVYVYQGEIFLDGQEVLSGKITLMEAIDNQNKE